MKNFNDIIQNLIEVNEKLSKGQIDINTAKVISQNTQVLINAAKVSLEFIKYSDKKETDFFISPASDNIEIPERKPFSER